MCLRGAHACRTALLTCKQRFVPPAPQDVGGEDRPLAPSLLRQLDYLCPNESELARLTGLPTDTEEQVGCACRFAGAAAWGTPCQARATHRPPHSWLWRQRQPASFVSPRTLRLSDARN